MSSWWSLGLQKYAGLAGSNNFHFIIARTVLIQFFFMVVGAVVSVFVTRELEIEGRGAVSWLVAFATSGAVIGMVGTAQATKKFISLDVQRAQAYVAFSGVLLMAGLLITVPIIYFYGMDLSVPSRYPLAFALALALVPLMAISLWLNDTLVGLGKALHSNMTMIVEKGLLALLNIALLLSGHVSIIAIMSVFFVALFMRVLVSVRYLRAMWAPLPSIDVLRDVCVRMYRDVLSSYITTICMRYANLCPIIALGLFAPVRELGYFAVARLVIENVLMIPTAIASFTLPQIAQKNTPQDKYRSKTHIIGLTFVVMLACAVPLYYFAPALVHVLFGSSFAWSAHCLQIAMFGMVANGIYMVQNQLISVQTRASAFVVAPLSVALCATGLLWRMRDDLTATQVAWIYSISYMIGLAVSFLILLADRSPRR